MATISAPAGLLLMASLLAIFSGFGPACADTPPAPARTVEGVATTSSGKPLAHATLYLFDLPPGQTDMITLGDQSTVVTDEHGHFTWAVPDALPPLSIYRENGGMRCFALAADRSTTQFRLALAPNVIPQNGWAPDRERRGLLERATRLCETKWQTQGAPPVFLVIVPDTSTVTLTLRGPDGLPLRAKPVQIVPAGEREGAVVYMGRTDAGGRLHFRCFPGSLRLQVFAPGVGFGSTGAFDALPGQDAAPAIPPLAPFARLSGTVAAALAAPGAFVHEDSANSSENVWYDPRAAVDAGGRWTLDGALPGPHRLTLTGGRGESEPVQVTVAPGQRLGGLTVGPKNPLSPAGALTAALLGGARMPPGSPPANKPAVRGRVTDTEGHPVAGAEVYAVCWYPSGMRGRQTVLATKTDAAGEYDIPSIPVGDGPSAPAVHLVAHQSGFPLAFGDIQAEKGRVSGQWKDMPVNLVIPALHSTLTVRVLQNGKSVPNVLVALSAQGENSVVPAMYRESDRGEAAQALRNLLGPSAQTGPDGAVRFQDLTPGLWDVTANRAAYINHLDKTPPPPFNVSTGVAVQAGKDQSFTLSLLPPPAEVAFHFAGPNGSLLPAVPASMSATTGLYSNYGNIALVPDGAGNGRGNFGAPGLFGITAQVAGRPLNINALVGPYFEGTSLVAVSAATASSQPISVPTRRVGPASIRVRLMDAQGKPLRGAVTIGDPFTSALYAASVGLGGAVVFPNIPLNFFPYTVTAHIAGRPERAAPGRQNDPLPSDAALIAGTGQPLPQSLRVRGGEETVATFGPVSPGYVRLRLTGPFASATGYNIEGRQTNDEAFTKTHFDPASGEYLLGPLPPGRRTFRLFRYVPSPVETNLKAGAVTVTVKAGKIVHANLAAQSTAGQELLYSAPLVGTVYLADGKTPAWGARAALFLPDWPVPRLMARTDTQGRLLLKDFWRDSARSRIVPPGNPLGPVVAAWLPGASGAVIVPFQPGRDVRLVLPPAITLHGRVTVSGHSVLGLPSYLRVRAAYKGKGRLNDALSVEATAQADGSFELAGLTPGTYQVQAARDNIWLSRTVTVTVGSGPLPDIALDIAPPGLPVLLHLVDAQGKPLPGQEIRIARPAGPLTEEVWPAALVSDRAGDLRVDGLEAGHHLVMTLGRAAEQVVFKVVFTVPAWTPNAPPAARRIIFSHTP